MCDDYRDFGAILNSYIGRNLVEFERTYGVRPISTMVRPQNRTEYTYITKEMDYGTSFATCTARIEADNRTGEIVNWSYEGEACVWHEYCAS